MSMRLVLFLASLVWSGESQGQVMPPGSASDHFKAGMSALAAEHYEKAEAEFQNAVEIDPLFDAAFYGLGQVYMATKRYERAVRAYLSSRDAFKASISAAKYDAVARNREEQRQLEARLNRSKGAPPLPVPAGLSMALGSAYYRTGDLEGAEREYLEAVRVDPAFGEAHSNLAVLYMFTSRLDQAELEVALAEKSGFKVNPRLKDDLKKQRGK
jgi:tetratricopeptide (TPR) repeat protein